MRKAFLSLALLALCGTASAQTDSTQVLIDRAEIEELVVRYVTALDTLDDELFASVFTEDAVYDVTGTVYRGRAQIRSIVTELQQSRARSLTAGIYPPALYHVMSNTSIELVSSTEARHTSYAQTVRAMQGGEFIVGFMGRYEDVIVKRDGRWQIQSRKLVSFVR
ncbi:MAG: nuclear transport factor 2 family protein [Gammaproteobacteria bacterium]|nr:nuclear transport factor 2 family protein [Gammaproteobacteria bacterium]